MSFRKRNLVVSSPGASTLTPKSSETPETPGVRPSPLDGRPTTSTGTRSLDSLLAGHAGLVLGTSILIEESGTTDFGGTLLRYYVAEGLAHGHSVHLLGVDSNWARDLPGLISADQNVSKSVANTSADNKMKIAWRYERLGEAGRDRIAPSSPSANDSSASSIFCHEFDLGKRFVLSNPDLLDCLPLGIRPSLQPATREASLSPLTRFLAHLRSKLSTTSPSTIHRVVIPNFLSPVLYPNANWTAQHVLQFFHSLRALLRKYSTRLTLMISLPLSLHPRTTGLTRWMEILSDGILELAPFPLQSISSQGQSSTSVQEEPPQGLLRVHQLPIFHERGGGGGEVDDDQSFTLSRRRGLVIKPYSLPPLDGMDEESSRKSEAGSGKVAKADVEF